SRTAGADFRACTELRGHQLFAFEAIERCVDGAGSNLTSEPLLHFFQDGAPVRVAAQPYDRQQHGLLERSQHLGHFKHYIVGFTGARSRATEDPARGVSTTASPERA